MEDVDSISAVPEKISSLTSLLQKGCLEQAVLSFSCLSSLAFSMEELKNHQSRDREYTEGNITLYPTG